MFVTFISVCVFETKRFLRRPLVVSLEHWPLARAQEVETKTSETLPNYLKFYLNYEAAKQNWKNAVEEVLIQPKPHVTKFVLLFGLNFIRIVALKKVEK